MSVLKTISYVLSNELDRMLICLFDANPSSVVDEENYQKFIETIQGNNLRYPKSSAVDGLLKSAQKQNDWQGALRHLMVIHKLIHDLGEECYVWTSSEKMHHFNHFKVRKTSLKTFLHNAMVVHYYNYLLKLSYNYDDFKICFHFDKQYPNKLTQNDISPLHSLSKLQNTLRYLIQIFPLFETSFMQFTPSTLLKQVAYFCLTDCYYFYTHINQIIVPLLNQFFTIPPQEAIFLYEMYSEHIIITRNLESAFSIAYILEEFPLNIPHFYQVDAENNAKIELYVASLRQPNQKNAPTRLEIKTEPDLKTSIKTKDQQYLSMKDVTQTIVDVITINNVQLSERQSPFETSKLNRKNTNKLRYVQSANQSSRDHESSRRTVDFVANSLQVPQVNLGNNPRINSLGHRSTCENESQLGHSSYPLAGSESFIREGNKGNQNPGENTSCENTPNSQRV